MKQLVLVGILAGTLGAGAALAQQATTNPGATADASKLPNPADVPTSQTRLATVRLPRAVVADDQTLRPGTYVVRSTGEALEPAVGETPNLEQWVEFVQGGKVKGKAVASIVPTDQIQQVAKMPPDRAPRPGQARVDVLKGNDYVRVWINHGGTNYLIHLPTQPS